MTSLKRVTKCVWIIWGIVIFCFLVCNAIHIYKIFTIYDLLRPFLFIYCFFVMLIATVYIILFKHLNCFWFGFLIFVGALTIRIISLYWSECIQYSDFAVYMNESIDFYNGDYQSVYNMTTRYSIPKFAGIGIFYGLLLHIFSPTMLGFQIINCILTSLICVLIYVICGLYSYKIASVGAFLYMIYPASILSSHITTNHHAATFFLMLSFYTFYYLINNNNCKKAQVFLIVITASFLALSDFMHPSVIIAICAFFAFSFMKILVAMFEKKIKIIVNIAYRWISVCIIYFILCNSGLQCMENMGLCDTKSVSGSSALYKIWVGLDIKHGGRWYNEIGWYMNQPDSSSQNQFYINQIRSNLKNTDEICKLIIEKTDKAWFKEDSYFGYYFAAKNIELSQLRDETQDIDALLDIDDKQNMIRLKQGILSHIDNVYVYFIWMFVLISLFQLVRMPENTIFDMVAWFPLGWMAFICITEMQSRYRYQSMPFLMLLAGLAIVWVFDKSKMIFNLKKWVLKNAGKTN